MIHERQYICGYIFVNFDVEETPWRYINDQPGVQRLLSTGPECPTRISDEVMAILLGRCSRDGIVDAEEVDDALARFVPVGAKVRISSGLFAGREGRVQFSDRERIDVVLGKMLGRLMIVPTKSDDVEIVSIT